MSVGKASAPSAPRLQISVAAVISRTERSAASVSVSPPAMWNSSSVPTIRSNEASVDCSFAVTALARDEAALPFPVPGHAPRGSGGSRCRARC